MRDSWRVLVSMGVVYLAACSSDTEPAQNGGGVGGSPSIVVSSGGHAGQTNAPPTTACEPLDPSAACVGEQYAGENLPLDIYVLFDQSGSMCSCIDPPGGQLCPDPSCRATRLDAIRAAMGEFVADPLSAGIGLGLTFFGQHPLGSADCNPASYAEPVTPIGALPGNASNIMQALNAVAPAGETPTGAALRGACEYADRSRRDSGHQVVILLLTDGKPEAPVTCAGGQGTCCPSLSDAVDAASACYAMGSGVRTYVLGVGPLLANLSDIAAAGGTERAYLVESGDVGAEVLTALNRIRADAAIPCELELPPAPPGKALDFNRVNIQYTSPECEGTRFYYVERPEDCGSHAAWYYDDPQNPRRIQLCPTSCEQVSAPGGDLEYTVGCERELAPPE